MNNLAIILILAIGLTGCSKSSSSPAAASSATASSSSGSPTPAPGPVQLKLQEFAGASATNCGELDVRAPQPQLKTASDCSMQASQGKHPFYVSYDMPGMSVGVAGNAEGKLLTVQTQGGAGGAALTSGSCPSALRVASSGRVTCFAPGDMSSMSGSHAAGTMPSAQPNPHSQGMPKAKQQ